ncbi:hypothetical protein L218DRAFT_481878 [Marasmius fiardii PR-910]|nr:hypothetical protein L218DRAFT_481878 [Marasmius fiardii PR-910]
MTSTYGAPAQNPPTGPRSRTNSLQYPHSYDRPMVSRGRSVSPPPARRYYNSYSPQSNNYRADPYWYQDSYVDYGRASPGASERYGRSYWDSSRERYDQRRPMSPVSSYSRSREPSGNWRDPEPMATRVFEPSDSWKQSNRDRTHSGGSSNHSPQRFYSQDSGAWTSYRYDDDRHYRPSSYDTDAPAVRGRFDTYRSEYDAEGENHGQGSYSRSPYSSRRRSRRSYSSERSKSRSRYHSRSRSRSRSRNISRTTSLSRSRSRSRRLGRSSRSLSRSRLRSPSSCSISRSRSSSSRSRSRSRYAKGSTLSGRYIDSEASTPARLPSPSVTQVRSQRDGVRRNANSTEPSTKIQPRSNVNSVYPNASRSTSSRSPSHSSIASSRETSVKPSAPAVHESDTPLGSQPSLDVKNTTLLSSSDTKCLPPSIDSTVLPQDLKVAGPCSVPEPPSQTESNGIPSMFNVITMFRVREIESETDGFLQANVTMSRKSKFQICRMNKNKLNKPQSL